jgi:hypothetical protein
MDHPLDKFDQIQRLDLQLQRSGEEKNIAEELIESIALLAKPEKRIVLMVVTPQPRGDELHSGADVVNGVSDFMSQDGCNLAEQGALGK